MCTTISLVFMLFFISVQCERIYIITSVANPCPSEYDRDHCLTLQQYASNSTFDSSDDLSLMLEPGDHSLDSQINVIGGNSFSLEGIDDAVHVVCSRRVVNGFTVRARVAIWQVQHVHLSGVTFVGCDQNGVFDAAELHIEEVHFRLSMLTAFAISRTANAIVLRSSFSDLTCLDSNFCSIRALLVTRSSLRVSLCSFSNIQQESESGGINIDNSDLIIESSSFRNISGQNGGAIRVTNSRNRTLLITNSTFHDNMAALQGGAIYVNISDITLEGCEFVNNTARVGGALFVIGTNVSVSISLSDFRSNVATQSGGSVAITDGLIGFPDIIDRLYPFTRSTVSVSQSNFMMNEANDGGAIVVEGRRSLFTLTQSSFLNNKALRTDNTGSGGAVVVSGTNSSIFIDQSNFTNNEADLEGGAVDISRDGSWIHARMCTFINNTARSGSGGAISQPIGENTNALIDECVFSGNQASFCGALDVIQATIMSTTFSHNKATTGTRSSNTWKTRGGGAICVRDSTTSLLSSTFSHNVAEESSGGVLNTFSGVWVEGSTFDNNRAGLDGGVILHHTANLTITQSNFTNNIADGFGGVMHGISVYADRINSYNNAAQSGGSLYISREAIISESDFVNNRATDDGGAVYLSVCNFCDNAAASISWSSFVNNAASQGVGGAIFITRHNVSLTGNIFSYNSASFCGALGVSWRIRFTPFLPYKLSITRNVFAHNRATGVDTRTIGGGGAACVKSGSVSIVESNFSHNLAIEHGGVMEVDNSTVEIQESTFDNNTARGNGGVIHASSPYLASTFEVYQSLFTSNQASRGDGGVFYFHSEGNKIQVTESSFGYNHAEYFGGVFSIEGATLVVNNGTVYDNTARRGDTISTCDSNVTLSSRDTYNISQRNQLENCFFYDITIQSSIEPTTPAPVESSTTVPVQSSITVPVQSSTEIIEPTTIVKTSTVAIEPSITIVEHSSTIDISPSVVSIVASIGNSQIEASTIASSTLLMKTMNVISTPAPGYITTTVPGTETPTDAITSFTATTSTNAGEKLGVWSPILFIVLSFYYFL